MARIQARNIGEVLLADYCPRCMWIKYRCLLERHHPLKSPMAGILSTLDAYTKKTVRDTLARTVPSWLFGAFNLKEPVRHVEPLPKWEHRFGNSTVYGDPDCIIEDGDGRWYILDYKTARWTKNQEHIWPLYEAQVNCYAWLARKRANADVAGLGIVYFEPRTDTITRLDGHDMVVPFGARVKHAEMWDDRHVEDLIRRVEAVLDAAAPPEGRENCPGCVTYRIWRAKLPP